MNPDDLYKVAMIATNYTDAEWVVAAKLVEAFPDADCPGLVARLEADGYANRGPEEEDGFFTEEAHAARAIAAALVERGESRS